MGHDPLSPSEGEAQPEDEEVQVDEWGGLPKPETVKVRNFATLPEDVRGQFEDGAVVSLDGDPVVDHSVPLGVMASIAKSVDRLHRATQAWAAGLTVGKRGAVAFPKGGGELRACPAVAGSYVLPLTLEPARGQTSLVPLRDLEWILAMLSAPPEGFPVGMPERIVDELRRLFKALSEVSLDLEIEVVRKGTPTAAVRLAHDEAGRRFDWLDEQTMAPVAIEEIAGHLYRLDAKNSKALVDREMDDGDREVVMIEFRPEQFEVLRQALKSDVIIRVDILEARRRFSSDPTQKWIWFKELLHRGTGRPRG